MAATALQLPLRAEDFFRGRARLVLPRLHLLAKLPRFSSCRLKKAVLLRALFGNARQLCARLLQLGCGRGDARLQFLTRSVLLRSRAAARSSSTAAAVGPVLRLLSVAVQLIAALGQRVLAGFLLPISAADPFTIVR